MLYNLININFIDRVMIVKYLSYSLGYRQPSTVNRQPSTVNRQHEINLFFAKFLYKLVQLFFNIIHCGLKKVKAWQPAFKKINFNYFEIISRFFMTFYIIVVDFTDYIITNYLLKNSLLKVFSLNSSFKNFYFENFYLNYSKEFSFNYLNSFLNFGVMNNFVKLNDFGNCYKWNGFLFNTKNQKKF